MEETKSHQGKVVVLLLLGGSRLGTFAILSYAFINSRLAPINGITAAWMGEVEVQRLAKF